MNSSLAIHVAGAKPGTRVEVVPGKTYVSLPLDSVESVAVTECVPAGDGTFRFVARVCPRWLPVTAKVLKRFGVPISTDGLNRLIAAGFVQGMRLTPGVRQFDFFSYRAHEQLAADPEFWDQTEAGQPFSNRERYNKAL